MARPKLQGNVENDRDPSLFELAQDPKGWEALAQEVTARVAEARKQEDAKADTKRTDSQLPPAAEMEQSKTTKTKATSRKSKNSKPERASACHTPTKLTAEGRDRETTSALSHRPKIELSPVAVRKSYTKPAALMDPIDGDGPAACTRARSGLSHQ